MTLNKNKFSDRRIFFLCCLARWFWQADRPFLGQTWPTGNSREALAIEVGQRLGGKHVVAVLNRLVAQRQAPNYLFVDNGSEFSGRLLDLWAYHCKARIDFSRPGKPPDNCYVETFNGSFRDECLN